MRCVLAVVMFLLPSVASAQQEHCVQALIQDKASLDLRESSSLALAELLRRSSSQSDDWTARISVPVKGIPVGGEANSVKTATEDYFSSTEVNWTRERIISVATQTLSSAAVEAYRACVGAAKSSGPQITIHSATRTAVTVRIKWIAPPNAPTTATSRIAVQGGTLDSAFPSEWRTGQSFSRIVTRDAKADLRVTADIGGDTDDQFVAYLPQWGPKPLVLRVGSCVGQGGQQGVRLWGPASEVCNGMKPWGYYDAQVRAITELGSCVGKGGFQGVRLYGPVGEPCGGMANNAWGTYENPVDVFRAGLSSCIGHGNILEGHRLWGPTGAPCGGFNDPQWGTYSEFTQKPK